MLFELLSIRNRSGGVRSRFEVRDWPIRIVNELNIFTIGSLNEANPLNMNIGRMDSVDSTAIIRSEILEADRFGDELLIFRRVSISNRWSGNGRHIVCINLLGRITTNAGNRNGLHRHCQSLLVQSVLEIHVETL